MTPFRKRSTPATKRMAEDMLIRNMAVRTIDTYTYHVDRFAKHFGKLPEDLGPEQIREFQLWMIATRASSPCTPVSSRQRPFARWPALDRLQSDEGHSLQTGETLPG